MLYRWDIPISEIKGTNISSLLHIQMYLGAAIIIPFWKAESSFNFLAYKVSMCTVSTAYARALNKCHLKSRKSITEGIGAIFWPQNEQINTHNEIQPLVFHNSYDLVELKPLYN